MTGRRKAKVPGLAELPGNGRMQGQIRSMQRAAAQPTTDTIRATGHSATFMNLSHFYPQ